MSQNPGLAFGPFLPHKKQRKSQMFLEFSKKNTWIQDPFERGPPQDLKATPCCAAILQPCSYAEAFLPPPLQKVVLLNMVSLFGSKANHACWDDFKNGSPLQQFLLKCENLVWFYLWSERQPETPSYLHQLQQHMPHQSVFFCSWPQGQPNRCKDQSPKSFQKIHVQKSMAAWRLPNHKQFLQLRFNMTLI